VAGHPLRAPPVDQATRDLADGATLPVVADQASDALGRPRNGGCASQRPTPVEQGAASSKRCDRALLSADDRETDGRGTKGARFTQRHPSRNERYITIEERANQAAPGCKPARVPEHRARAAHESGCQWGNAGARTIDRVNHPLSHPPDMTAAPEGDKYAARASAGPSRLAGGRDAVVEDVETQIHLVGLRPVVNAYAAHAQAAGRLDPSATVCATPLCMS
jgi:hypothetical protein